MIDVGTIALTAGIAALVSAVVQMVVLIPYSRSLARRDREMINISERLSKVEFEYIPRRECEKQHQTLQPQLDSFLAAVIKLERVSTETNRLLQWIDDVSKEQISIGKDLAAVISKVAEMQKNESN